MKRFRQLMMTACRPRLLLLTAFAVAVSVLVSGINVTYAHPVEPDAKLTPEQAAHLAKRKDDAAAKARAKRAELLTKKKAAKEYMRKVVEGQESGGAK